MPKKSNDSLLKKLVESNLKMQESVSAVVSSVKELVTSIREAAEVPDEEFKYSQDDKLLAISAKLDKILQQNEQLLGAMKELKDNLKRPQEYRRL